MIPTSRKPGAALLATRRAAQIHQYNHLALNLSIYHEVVTTSKAYITLAYFASPLRLMVRETFNPPKIDPLLPVLGGLALVCGIALLFVRPRKNKKIEGELRAKR